MINWIVIIVCLYSFIIIFYNLYFLLLLTSYFILWIYFHNKKINFFLSAFSAPFRHFMKMMMVIKIISAAWTRIMVCIDARICPGPVIIIYYAPNLPYQCRTPTSQPIILALIGINTIPIVVQVNIIRSRIPFHSIMSVWPGLPYF